MATIEIFRVNGEIARMGTIDAANAVRSFPLEWSSTPWSEREAAQALAGKTGEQLAAFDIDLARNRLATRVRDAQRELAAANDVVRDLEFSMKRALDDRKADVQERLDRANDNATAAAHRLADLKAEAATGDK